MRSIVALSSERTTRLSEPTSASATWSRRPVSSAGVIPTSPPAPRGSGWRSCGERKLSRALLIVALVAPQRARRPVVAAQLVEHRAVDPRPGVLLERRALVGVVALDRVDQRLQAAGEEVLDVALRRHLAHLAVDDVADHRHEHEDQPVAQLAVAACGGTPARSPAPRLQASWLRAFRLFPFSCSVIEGTDRGMARLPRTLLLASERRCARVRAEAGSTGHISLRAGPSPACGASMSRRRPTHAARGASTIVHESRPATQQSRGQERRSA